MKFLTAIFLLVSVNLWAEENSVTDLANQYFQDLHSLSANFVQSSTNPITNQLQYFSGRIDLAQKENTNQFRFQYDPPNQQLVVGNEQYVWMVDYDLEQITRYQQNFMDIPIAKLLTNPQFEWIQSKNFNQDQLHYFRVISDNQESEVVLVFKNEQLNQVVSQDSLENLLVFELTDPVKNQPINQSLFQVTNPNGFDFIEVE